MEISFPCLLFTATDGCFGYYPTPMHFEHFLLSGLVSTENVAQWKEKIETGLFKYAGDDYTMCMAGFGYKDFKQLKQSFKARCDELFEKYIASDENADSLWKQYKKEYYY